MEQDVAALNPKLKGWVMQKGIARDYLVAHIEKDAKILDIGSGGGHFLLSCLDAGYKNLSGSDLHNYLQFDALKPLVDFKESDLNKEPLPFPDAYFDVVTSFHTFEHLENPFHFIRECARVLKPGGTFILAYPYAWSIQSRLLFLFTGNVIGYRLSNSHITFLTKSIWQKCFGRKFRKIKEYFYRGKLGFLGFTIHLPANKYFGNAVCYILEKQYFADKPY